MLRKYEEALQLCEQTLPDAEKNFASVLTDNGSVTDSLARLRRWRLISKSYFCTGKLEVAIDLLQKLERVGSMSDNEILESSISLAATIRALLHRKEPYLLLLSYFFACIFEKISAGNEAVKSGRYTEAVEHYTVALSTNIESRPIAAICFRNRAAALQALGQIADAMADCSLAMALDENYTKAVSRRAALHEMIRDYTQAASDLQRLVSILENQSAEKAKQSRSPGRTISSRDIRQACRLLFTISYCDTMGVKAFDTAADIKKAYRKAALKHHPDKAGQFLVRTENGDEGQLWKEIAHEVQKDADRLFKMIGEAYAVLSDPNKRSEYDQEQEIRKATKESPQSSHYRRSSDAYSYAYRSSRRQSWQDNWKTYGNSYSRW
ncbi:Heat shock protein DnaJ with tetratricopeptide repeat-containing protein [Citrus sinensis]|nr:Heat shock protein DnaJ with tetratricopeptide repeat-containing protein [Citrus sinensis]